jgi:hypothetical protein
MKAVHGVYLFFWRQIVFFVIFYFKYLGEYLTFDQRFKSDRKLGAFYLLHEYAIYNLCTVQMTRLFFFLRENLMTLDQNSYRKDLHENKVTPKSYCNPRSLPARRTCRWRGRRRFSTDAINCPS